jgi:hypothetical protein
MGFCPRCGFHVQPGMNFCPKCGFGAGYGGHNPVPQPPQHAFVEKQCGACLGFGVDGLGHSCPGCGRRGVVMVPDPPRRCRSCNGTGIDALGHPHKPCRGTGWFGGRRI